jgi:hypothetical protein
MTIIVQDRAVVIPSGSFSIPAENVPDTLTSVRFSLKRCTTATPTFWPNIATVLNAEAWLSIDGAAFRMCGFVLGAPGGIEVENSIEQPLWWWGFSLFPGVNRQARFEVSVVNGPLVSELTLEAF